MGSMMDCPTIPASPLDNHQLNINLKNELNAEVICTYDTCISLIFQSFFFYYQILTRTIRYCICALII